MSSRALERGTVGRSDEEDAIIDRSQISQSYRDLWLPGFVAESRVGHRRSHELALYVSRAAYGGVPPYADLGLDRQAASAQQIGRNNSRGCPRTMSRIDAALADKQAANSAPVPHVRMTACRWMAAPQSR